MVEQIEGSVGCKQRVDFTLESQQHPVTKFIAPAALKKVSIPAFSLDWISLCKSGEPLLTFMHRQVQTAIAQAPSVLYIPDYDTYDPIDPQIVLDLIPPHCSV